MSIWQRTPNPSFFNATSICARASSKRNFVVPKLCAFFRSESCVSSQSEGGLKQTPCKLLVIQGLLCIKSYAQDYLWIASLEAAFLLGFRGPSQKPCLSRSW